MFPIPTLLLGVLAAVPPQSDAESSSADPPDEHFLVERGEELVPLRVPRGEELRFSVSVDLGLLDTVVGKVTMKSEVEPYRESLLVPGSPEEGDALHTAHLSVHAKGDHSFYSMDATIDTRILPQEWPRISYRYVHEGSENRRREILLGFREDQRQSSYRKDTKKGAPRGTRIWREPAYREVPEGTLDMLSALYLTRSLVTEELRVVRFPLIDKSRVWQLRLTKGRRKRMETAAGTFDVVEILLEPSPYPGEVVDEEKEEKFQGLFGIHGSIHLWAERRTGIPVRIQGDLPIGPLTIGIDVELQSYEGTPADFAPLKSRK